MKQEADQTQRLYLDGGLNVAQFKGIYQPLDARKHQIEEEIPRIEAEADLLKVNGLTTEHIMAEANALHTRWPKMTSEGKRGMVELLVKTITVGKDDIHLSLY